MFLGLPVVMLAWAWWDAEPTPGELELDADFRLSLDLPSPGDEELGEM